MTTGGSNPKAEKAARCGGWRPLDYAVDGKNDPEGHGDTDRTINGIRIHNQTGVNKGCWKNVPTPPERPRPSIRL